MNPECLARTVQEFVGASREAVVLENGSALFDLATARYSISANHSKCLLHLWSSERNIVRRVLDAESKNGVLRLSVLRLGQARATKLEICRERDRRTASAKKTARNLYQSRLRRALESRFPDYRLIQLSSSMDLERSFGPVYARGLLRKGQSSFAVLGVNAEETQPSVDGALTFGILWLQRCREAQDGKCVVEGLRLFVPPGCEAIARERMSCLDRATARWHLFTFDERQNEISEVDCLDRGNVATRLVHCPDEASARSRFAESITRIQQRLPPVTIAVLSPAEITFRLHGLELARARLSQQPGSSPAEQEIVFGIGPEERVLDDRNFNEFVNLIRSAGEVRHPDGPRDHPLFRLHPERWLESVLVQDVTCVDERLEGACVYSQVPAFSASDRAMVDVLTTNREGRLTILELKAEEDIHLPLQGLDYWSRVNWHQARGEFTKFGYFPGRELSAEAPLLYLVAPALHVHPATDTLLHYFSPEIDWVLIGIDERWRHGVRPVFRKRARDRKAA
ncbi:MAG TPA: hypothetical protein VMT53_06600 [Terriglobales bacterium]|nr:hypothetical protein [Terriglobales bacterium]